jgi:hypothetical protein
MTAIEMLMVFTIVFSVAATLFVMWWAGRPMDIPSAIAPAAPADTPWELPITRQEFDELQKLVFAVSHLVRQLHDSELPKNSLRTVPATKRSKAPKVAAAVRKDVIAIQQKKKSKIKAVAK